jgi:hypothetical protein
VHPFTAQQIAAERQADFLRAATRPRLTEVEPPARPRPALRRLQERYARRAAGAAGAAARSGT